MSRSGEASDGLHHGSPTVVKLEVGLHQRDYIREHEGPGVVKLVRGFTTKSTRR